MVGFQVTLGTTENSKKQKKKQNLFRVVFSLFLTYFKRRESEYRPVTWKQTRLINWINFPHLFAGRWKMVSVKPVEHSTIRHWGSPNETPLGDNNKLCFPGREIADPPTCKWETAARAPPEQLEHECGSRRSALRRGQASASVDHRAGHQLRLARFVFP